MPKEACEICRRARFRHKTRKKTDIVQHAILGFSRTNDMVTFGRYHPKKKQKQQQKTSVRRTKAISTREPVRQDNCKVNPELKHLLELLDKEQEIEEVTSQDNDTRSIVLDSDDESEAAKKSLNSPVSFLGVEKQITKETLAMDAGRSLKKPSLVNFMIADSTLQQCAELLQSLPADVQRAAI